MEREERIWEELKESNVLTWASYYQNIYVLPAFQFKKALPIIEAELNRWIPVGERLPDTYYEEYIVGNSHTKSVARRIWTDTSWDWGYWTHWIDKEPLPDPPKGE